MTPSLQFVVKEAIRCGSLKTRLTGWKNDGGLEDDRRLAFYFQSVL